MRPTFPPPAIPTLMKACLDEPIHQWTWHPPEGIDSAADADAGWVFAVPGAVSRWSKYRGEAQLRVTYFATAHVYSATLAYREHEYHRLTGKRTNVAAALSPERARVPYKLAEMFSAKFDQAEFDAFAAQVLNDIRTRMAPAVPPPAW